jgi:hypothetical protein
MEVYVLYNKLQQLKINIIWSNKKYILWRVNSGDGKKTEAQTVSFTWNIFLSSIGQSISKLELWVTSLSDTPRLQYYDVQTLEF